MLSVQDLLLLNPPASKFAFVQKAWNSTAGGAPATTTVSLPSVGAGHLVVVSVDYLGTATGFTITIADGNGNSFTLSPNSPFKYNAVSPMVWLGYILSAQAGTMTVTVTPSVAHGLSVHVAEFSYTGTCSFDVDAGAFATSGTTPISTPSITPGVPNVLLYATAIADPTGTGSFLGSGDGWTDGTIGVIALDSNNSADAYILVESGLKKVNWTASFSTGTGWVAAAMSFKVTATAGAIAGSSAGVATISGTLAGAGQLAGTVVAAASSASALVGAGQLNGNSAGVATASATGFDLIAGTSTGVASATATISAQGSLIGSSAGVGSNTSSLVGAGSLAGNSAGVSSSVSLLKGAGVFAGNSAGIAASTSSLLGAGALNGTIAGVAGNNATLINNVENSGTAAGVSTVSGTLAGNAALQASSAGVTASTAALQGFGALLAQSAGVASSTAALAGSGVLTGSSTGLASASGLLLNGTGTPAFIFGRSSGTTQVFGSLHDAVNILIANAFVVPAIGVNLIAVPAINIEVLIKAAINVTLEVIHS